MFSKIILIFKMIGWFFIEIFELLTGKRKLMQEYDTEADEKADEDDSDAEDEKDR